MGAQIEVYRAVTFTLNGGTMPKGQMLTPFATIETSTLLGPIIDDHVVLLAGETKTLWEYGVNSGDWSLGWVEQSGGNATSKVWLIITQDTAVSASVLTASGLKPTKNREILRSWNPRFWGGRTTLTNASAANHASTGTNEEEGYIYKIEAYNPGTTDVRLRRVFLG